MKPVLGIAGERWELVFAAATAASIGDREGMRLVVPEFFAGAVGADCEAVPVEDRFVSYPEVCALLHARSGARVVRAGSLFRGDGWTPPPHRPPDRPAHATRGMGALAVVEVDGGDGYFQGLMTLAALTQQPVWEQYGPGRPVFVFNTNDFDEPRIEAHDTYAILASGLLGLAAIAESDPPPGARVVVYDIHPGALAWSRFVLAAAERTGDLDAVIGEFRRARPEVEVRDVLPHERENADRQRRWFREWAPRLAALAHALRWEYVECDLLRDPRPLLDRLVPSPRLFFMYLDLFTVWHVRGARAWIEDHRGMAASLERLVRDRNGGRVTFLPNERSRRLQISPASPFLREVTPCT